MVNAVMRNIQRLSQKIAIENVIDQKKIELAYPKWLLKKWEDEFGKTVTKIFVLNF